MSDQVLAVLKPFFASHGFTQKKNGWYIVDHSGIRGVHFEKDRWREKSEQRYDPIICCFPIEFMEDDRIPPYFKFPIREYASEISSINWDAVKVNFDLSSIEENRKLNIEEFLSQDILPFLSQIETTEDAFALYDAGIIGNRAFLRPVRPKLIERLGKPLK